MKPFERATSAPSTVDRLDQIRMSPDTRRMAQESMRQAELIADMLVHASDDLCHLFGFIGRSIGALARRGKVSPVAPKWRAP